MSSDAPLALGADALRVTWSEPSLCSVRLHRAEPWQLSALGASFSCTWPQIPNTTANDGGILWLSPTEWAIIGRDVDWVRGRVRAACAGALCDVTDMTGAYACYDIAGREASGFLSKSCSLDLHPRVFGEARCARTVFAQVPAVIVRAAQASGFKMYVDTSLSRYVDAWIRDAASEFIGDSSPPKGPVATD